MRMRPHSRRVWIFAALAAALVCLGIAAAVVLFWKAAPRLTEEQIEDVVLTTIRQESPAAVLVTGYLDMSATVTVASTRVLFPDLGGIDLGDTRTTIRVPGRVTYGFDVSALNAEAIRLAEGGAVEVSMPALRVVSVAPDLARLEVQTKVGWARSREGSGKRVEREALRLVQESLRTQAERHLATSTQPKVNTAHALEKMLAPPLRAAGVAAPRFRFFLTPELLLEPKG